MFLFLNIGCDKIFFRRASERDKRKNKSECSGPFHKISLIFIARIIVLLS
jgi:hypothetical protein